MNENIIKIAKHYGIEAQARQTMEECAELIVALNKYLRFKYAGQSVRDDYFDIRNNIEEEIADVEIMLEQIKCLLACSAEVETWKNKKIERTLNGMVKEDERKRLYNAVPSSVTLEDMDFSVRAYNCLKRVGINTLQDLSEHTEEEFMRVRNLGRRSLQEVIDKCKEYGVEIKRYEG